MAKLDNSQIISHTDLPDDVDKLITKAANKAVKKAAKNNGGSRCDVCNRTLANPAGLASHKKATKCGVISENQKLLATATLAAKATAKVISPKTEKVQIKEIDYKLSVMKLQVMQTAVRWISTATAVTAIAYHIV